MAQAAIAQVSAVVEVKARRIVGRDDRGGRRAVGQRGRWSCLQVAEDAAVEEHRILQAEFDAELVGAAQMSIEAIITSIMTMGGRASSCSMMPRTSSKNLGVELKIRLFVTGSATTTTSRSICSNALVSPGPACCRICRSVVRNVLIVVATSVAGEFFSRITTLLRCRTSPSSSFVRIASTMFRSAIVPEAITLLVRVSTPKRSGTSEVSLPLEVHLDQLHQGLRHRSPAAAGLPREKRLEHVGEVVASPLTMVKTLIWASAAGRLSNCRTRPSSSSRFSGGEEISRELARTSGVMRTS